MKLFITGISGLLGLNTALQAKDHCEVSGCYFSHPVCLEGVRSLRVDLTSYEDLRNALEETRPDVILHTAGLANVDRCEEDTDLAYRLNVGATENIARIASFLGSTLIHISSDHLYAGTQAFVGEETPPAPLNAYGITKWEAEKIVQRCCPGALIIRTNFYGWGTSIKKSFSDWILAGLKDHEGLTLFSDVYFTPILINDLIDILFNLLDSSATGIYNIGGRDRVSKHLFALRLAEVFGWAPNGIRPISVDQAGLKARRPKDMSLSYEKAVRLLGRGMPGLTDGLQRLKDLYEQGWHRAVEMAVQDEERRESLCERREIMKR